MGECGNVELSVYNAINYRAVIVFFQFTQIISREFRNEVRVIVGIRRYACYDACNDGVE